MGPLRSGPRGGTGPWGKYKTPGMVGFIRAQRGRARTRAKRAKRAFQSSVCNFLLASVFAARNNIYLHINKELLEMFGQKPDDAYVLAKNNVLTVQKIPSRRDLFCSQFFGCEKQTE